MYKQSKKNEVTKISLKQKIKSFFVDHKNLEINQEFAEFPIYIKDFTKKFKKFTAVDNVTIKVQKGTIHGFIGPNGSGKTTTIKCLISALLPTQGQLMVYGQNSSSVSAKKLIGYIPESARFSKKVSAYNYLIAMAQISGLSLTIAKTRAETILKELNLWEFKKRSPNTYSSGMKKKVLLAQALLTNPDVLVLDEPAANLDPTARTELFNDLKKIRDQGKTIFISSHILSELQNFVDEVTVLNHSKVIFHGSVKPDDSQYEINTSDNNKLVEILTANNFIVENLNEKILIKIDHPEKTNEVIQLVAEAKIVVSVLKPYVFDLQLMYEKLIMEQKNKKGQ